MSQVKIVRTLARILTQSNLTHQNLDAKTKTIGKKTGNSIENRPRIYALSHLDFFSENRLTHTIYE